MGGRISSVIGTLMSAFMLFACASTEQMAPVRHLTTSTGIRISMADDCGTGSSRSSQAWISFNQLAIHGATNLRWPVIFDYTKTGQTASANAQALAVLSGYASMIHWACINLDVKRDPDIALARDHADQAIIAAIEAGLRLEQPMSKDQFLKVVDEEDRRKEALFLRGRKWFEY